MAIAYDDLFGGGTVVNFLGTGNTSTYTTNAGGAASNGTFLPSDNALVLAFVSTSDTAAAGTFQWDDTSPYSFTKVGDFVLESAGTPRRLYVFRALRSTWGATAKTGTFSCSGDAATGCNIRIVQFTGVDTSGTNGSGAIVQEQSATNQTSANPTLTLSALDGSGNNAVISAFANDVNPFGGTAEASWTERSDSGYNTPTTGLAIYYRLATTDNTVSVTRAATDWSGWAAELKPPGATTITGVALSVTPSLPAAALRHDLTGAALTITPTLPAGSVGWTSLVGHYDFSDAATVYEDTGLTDLAEADDIIKGIRDKSNAGNHLTEATNGPTFKTNVQNGLSVARFDGTDDTLRRTATPITIDATIFFVGKKTGGAALAFFQRSVGSGIPIQVQVGLETSGTVKGVMNHRNDANVSTPIFTTTTFDDFVLVVGRYNGAAQELYGNMALENTATNAGGTTTTDTLMLGKTPSAGGGIGDVGEVIVFNRALGTTERENLSIYLINKWRLAIASGVALSVTPTLPQATLRHDVTGVALTVTPSLPAGTVGVAGGTVTGVALTVTPSLPAATLRHSLTAVVLSVTPTLPAGSLRHNVTGVALSVTPTLPAGIVQRHVAGVVLTITPTLPAGSVTRVVNGVVLTIVPTLPAGTVQAPLVVSGVVLTIVPTFPQALVHSPQTFKLIRWRRPRGSTQTGYWDIDGDL